MCNNIMLAQACFLIFIVHNSSVIENYFSDLKTVMLCSSPSGLQEYKKRLYELLKNLVKCQGPSAGTVKCSVFITQ